MQETETVKSGIGRLLFTSLSVCVQEAKHCRGIKNKTKHGAGCSHIAHCTAAKIDQKSPPY